jgi:hypothetical protein
MNLSVEPSIEDIRKMGNDRRPKVKAPPAPKKITRKKVKEPEPIPVPEPEPEGPEIEEESEEEESEEEIIIPIPKKTSRKKVIDNDYEVLKEIVKTSNKKDNKDFDVLFKSITDIKELISNQKNVIEEAIKPKIEEPKTKSKPKPKPKAKPKPKPKGKTLDLVVSDKELEQIINPPPNNTKPIDPKLEAFLKAFQK